MPYSIRIIDGEKVNEIPVETMGEASLHVDKTKECYLIECHHGEIPYKPCKKIRIN